MRSTPYELELGSNVERGPEVFTFGSADGVVSKDEFRTAELLLLEAVDPDPSDDVLVVDGNYGVPGVVLAHLAPDGLTVVTESSARAARLCRENARANDADLLVELVADVADVDGEFDLAVYAPKPYDPTAVAKQKIADALGGLAPGGQLVVAAEKNAGARRYRETMADLAGGVERLTRRAGHWVLAAPRPTTAPDERFVEDRVVEATVAGQACTFVTRPGLFSPGGVDRGTELLIETLLEHSPPGADDRLLDLACGYGPVGIATALATDCEVVMTDDSRVATVCARESARRSGVDPVAVRAGDCLEAVRGEAPFDVVAMNPPTHAGGGVTDELFAGARECLAPGGELWLVYNETMAYEDTLPFDEATVVRRTEGYAITRAR